MWMFSSNRLEPTLNLIRLHGNTRMKIVCDINILYAVNHVFSNYLCFGMWTLLARNAHQIFFLHVILTQIWMIYESLCLWVICMSCESLWLTLYTTNVHISNEPNSFHTLTQYTYVFTLWYLSQATLWCITWMRWCIFGVIWNWNVPIFK